MEDLLSDIKDFLIANGITESIFRDTIDDETDTAVALYEYQGNNPSSQIAGADRPIQFVARSRSAVDSKLLIRRIYKKLETEDSIIQLTPERWAMVFLRQTPFKMKIDDKGRTYYVFNTTFTTYLE